MEDIVQWLLIALIAVWVAGLIPFAIYFHIQFATTYGISAWLLWSVLPGIVACAWPAWCLEYVCTGRMLRL